MENEAIKLRQYLLGSLPETESEKLDIRIISDKHLEEELYLAETALIEDYLEKNLSPAETELFYENFLVTETRKDQTREIAAIKNLARNITRNEMPEKQPGGLFRNLSNLFTLNFRHAAAFGLLLFVLLGAAVWQFGLLNNETASFEKETIALNRQDLSDLSKYENLTKLNLGSGLLRSGGENEQLAAGRLSENVLLRLSLPPQETAGLFSAKVIRDQKEAVSLEKVPAYRNQTGQEIRLLLPAQFLQPGEYKIEILPENKSDFPHTFSFTVQ